VPTVAAESSPEPPPAVAAATGPISNAIIRVTRLHRMRAQQLLREVGLHPGQELLLMHLWAVGPQRQSTLMAVFDTDSASMTRTVQRLERSGFVRRRPDPADRRATLVESTPAGLGLRTRIEGLWAELEAITTGDMTERERTALLTALEHAEANLLNGVPDR
jgi:MarR family transcriptional regulator, organic hydroperoxide resistance regulator